MGQGEFEGVALDQHAEHPEQQDSAHEPDVETLPILLLSPGAGPFCERKGQGNAADKEKERHDQVPGGKPLPLHMMELVFEPFRDGIDKQGQERENEGIAADNPEHVEASEGVDRGEPFGGRVFGNVFVPGFSGGGFHDSSPVLRGEATPLQVHNVTHSEHLRGRGRPFLWRTAPSPWRTAPAGSIVSTSLWMSSTSGRLPISRKADRVA